MDIVKEINEFIKKLDDSHDQMMRGHKIKLQKEQESDNEADIIISKAVYPPTATILTRTKQEENEVEKDFFELYERQPLLALEVGHNSVTDWNILVYDRRGKEVGDWGDPVIHVQGSHRELVFAKAYAELAEYFSEHFGGY